MAETNFPIAVLYEGQGRLALIDKPENLISGKSFRVVLTRVTSEQFQIADQVAYNILRAQNA